MAITLTKLQSQIETVKVAVKQKFEVLASEPCSARGLQNQSLPNGKVLNTIYYIGEGDQVVGYFTAEKHGGKLVIDFAVEMTQKPESIEIDGEKLHRYYVRYSLVKKATDEQQVIAKDDLPF